ncbi:acyl-CoA thioesterase [Aestuariicella hydrocarbonica]|uniref:Acyl-CoA thioesterase n=1 Tax=Pseudomaricurvus hydrocarbonicus TaxID=1470433 RepID=A0A9E5JQF9_9GAMM|nr:thioesterase family protein [Aestuariicella hydrocarbonica]NHO64589.1 acyl-CoA thioesterase [Aestuariicella hydrocarbonica]
MKLPVTRTTVQTRYSDTDAMGHISSGSYVTFMEVGRLDFFDELEKLTPMAVGMVVANINLDYIQECVYGDHIEVVTWCSRVGTKSMTLRNEIYANGTLRAKGSVTSVGFDMTTRKAAALPEQWEASEAV